MSLLVSKPAPPFEGIAVINGEFKEIRLSDFKDKYLVLLFYPLDLYVEKEKFRSFASLTFFFFQYVCLSNRNYRLF